MEKNTVLLQDTEAFMHGELDNVTVQQNCIVLDLVQGGYVPYGCYTSAPIPMPLFDALRVSWNAASPEDTAVEAQVRVMVDGNWTTWNSFGKWSPSLHREGPSYQARGPVQRWPDRLQLDSKYATAVQLRIYLYSKNEKVSPAVMLLGASVRVVDVIPARGRLVNARLHLMPYTAARRAPALQPWMDAAISLASLTNRWGADLLPEEFAQVLRDWRAPDDCGPRNLSFAAAAARSGASPRGWPTRTWRCCAPRPAPGAALSLHCNRPRHRSPPERRSGTAQRCAGLHRRWTANPRCCSATRMPRQRISAARSRCRWTTLWSRGTMWPC